MVLFYSDVRSCKIANCPQPIAGWITFWTSSVPLLQLRLFIKQPSDWRITALHSESPIIFPAHRTEPRLGLSILIRRSQSNTYSLSVESGENLPSVMKRPTLLFQKNKEWWLCFLRPQLQVCPCEYPLFCRLRMHNSSFMSCCIYLLFITSCDPSLCFIKMWSLVFF